MEPKSQIQSQPIKINPNTNSSLDTQTQIQTPIQTQSVTDQALILSQNIMILILSYIGAIMMKPLNFLLLKLKQKLSATASNSIQGQYDENLTITDDIHTILSNPVVIGKWEKISEDAALYIKTLLDQIEDKSLDEFKNTLNQMVDILEDTTRNAVIRVIGAVIEGVCMVPMIAPVCEGLNLGGLLISTAQQSAAVFVSLLNTVFNLVGIISNVFGKSQNLKQLQGVLSTVNELKETVEVAKNAIQKPGQIMSNINDTVVNQIDSVQNSIPSITPPTLPIRSTTN
jgi:hypothetical protein